MFSREKIRERLAALNLREQIILLCLLVLVLGVSFDFLFNKTFLEQNRELRSAVATAEEKVRHNEQLLSRKELIHAQYQKLESPSASGANSALTETDILRELADLAGNKVFVKNMVPRSGHFEGQPVMFVALDIEGPFKEIVDYLDMVLSEMPSEVENLSLSPWAGNGQGVVCRLSIRVECFDS